MNPSLFPPATARWTPYRAKQRAAGDWVVENVDRQTGHAQRWTVDGDNLTEAEAREIARELNGGRP